MERISTGSNQYVANSRLFLDFGLLPVILHFDRDDTSV